jgi:hypothetical protein
MAMCHERGNELHADFEIAGGSVPGRAHVAAGRNNQDAFCWTSTEKGLVAVVCDGCGSGPHSELGAQLGARLVVQAAARLLACELSVSDLLERVEQDVLARLRILAAEMSSEWGSAAAGSSAAPNASFARTVSDYLLFTVVGLIIMRDSATTFAAGDGLIVVNDDVHHLGPFPNNEPPYLGYALLARGAERSNEHSAFRIHRRVPVEEIRSLLLGTDGAVDLDAMADRAVHGRAEPIGPLSQFWTDDRFFRNSDMVRRRLTVINRGPRSGALPDDTTLVVVRRKAAEA